MQKKSLESTEIFKIFGTKMCIEHPEKDSNLYQQQPTRNTICIHRIKYNKLFTRKL